MYGFLSRYGAAMLAGIIIIIILCIQNYSRR